MAVARFMSEKKNTRKKDGLDVQRRRKPRLPNVCKDNDVPLSLSHSSLKEQRNSKEKPKKKKRERKKDRKRHTPYPS